jgi:uncharacterized membrane protein
LSNLQEPIKSVAAAVFTIPQDRGELLQSLYYLFIILFVIYILTAIAISSQRTSGLSKAKVRSKRTFYFISGLVLAIVGVSFYKLFNLVMPLFVLLIAAGTFLVWNRNKGGSVKTAGGTNFVMVPPTDKKN